MRKYLKIAVFICLFQILPTGASQKQPMRFSTYWPCSGNASFCGVRILAQGVIQRDTGRLFAQFLSNPDSHGHALPPVPTVVFDSPGGSIAGAMELGRIIRSKKMNTEIAAGYSRVKKDTSNEELFVSSAVCASACSLAFAGGVNRFIDTSARVGVHQFSISSGSMGDSETQVTLTVLANYLDSMGVNRLLLDRASLVPPSSMYWLTNYEVTRFRLDNTQPILAAWTISANAQGSPILQVIQPISEGREAIVALKAYQGSIEVSVTTTINKASYSEDRIAQFPVGQPALISICGDKGCYRTTSIQVWSKKETGAQVKFQAVSILQTSALRDLVITRKLFIEDGFGSATNDISLATDLSTTGFGSGANLLLRQN